IPLIVPLPVMLLGIFVAFVQTLVFVLLSMAYFAGAIAHEELE
ncbi:MAG: F0F1 ATP synthase subunit A, partial [Deltaproteobacteria bacterium]|nr:F0F1 ATP synthase subunit A [Deltaproteobacteria bacterium]